jgi:ribosomal protein S18 acetylase RimI-like enzyme
MNHEEQPSPDREAQGEPVLLMSIRDGLEAGMIEAMLENAGIPVLRRYPETGQLLHMVMGTSLYGTELYVPGGKLEAARALVADVTRGETADTEASGLMQTASGTGEAIASGQTEYVIRPMAATDWPALERLWKQTPGVGLRYPDDSEEGLSRYLQRNPATCFVAETGDRLVGSVLAGHDGRRGYLYHLAVSADFRRQGIGRALVESAVDMLRREGIRKAGIVVFGHNDDGNPFWEAIGWQRRADLVYRDHSLLMEESPNDEDG